MANSPFDVDPPLSLEPIVGWRVWGLDRVGGALTLRSVTRPAYWPPKDAMVATCFAHRAWTVPDVLCACGLYAAASPEHLARSGVLGMETSVVGTVAMWGRVIEHTLGARSRFAYPARLRLVCGPCLAVGAGAVTPVRVLGEHGSLKAVCQAHWSGPTARAAPAADVEAELLSSYGVELLPIEQLSRGLRTRPVRITRPSVPTTTPTMTSRVNASRILIGMYFVFHVISALMQPASDASAAQPDVISSPPAPVSSSTSMVGDHIRVAAGALEPGTSSTALRLVRAAPTSITSWPRWRGPSSRAHITQKVSAEDRHGGASHWTKDPRSHASRHPSGRWNGSIADVAD